jgi:hypothetical protein
MLHPRKIVLHCFHGCDPRLDALVEGLIREGVRFVAVVGKDCERVEDTIDELVVRVGGPVGSCVVAGRSPIGLAGVGGMRRKTLPSSDLHGA